MLTLYYTVDKQRSQWQRYSHSLLSHITSPKCPTWPMVADRAQESMLNTENSHRPLIFVLSQDLLPSLLLTQISTCAQESFVEGLGSELCSVRAHQETIRDAKFRFETITSQFVICIQKYSIWRVFDIIWPTCRHGSNNSSTETFSTATSLWSISAGLLLLTIDN